MNLFPSLIFFVPLINSYLFVCLFIFQDRVSLYSSGCPGNHSVDQAGLKLRHLPASASGVLGLEACATMPGLEVIVLLVAFMNGEEENGPQRG